MTEISFYAINKMSNNLQKPTNIQTLKSGTTTYQGIDLNVFENINYPFCSYESKYEKIVKIGQGTFG